MLARTCQVHLALAYCSGPLKSEQIQPPAIEAIPKNLLLQGAGSIGRVDRRLKVGFLRAIPLHFVTTISLVDQANAVTADLSTQYATSTYAANPLRVARSHQNDGAGVRGDLLHLKCVLQGKRPRATVWCARGTAGPTEIRVRSTKYKPTSVPATAAKFWHLFHAMRVARSAMEN